MELSEQPDESDSRTATVGRKRGFQDHAGTSYDAISISDSSGDEAYSRGQKRRKQSINTNDEEPLEQMPPPNSHDDLGTEVGGGKLAEMSNSILAPVSWNKGIQGGLRTSFSKSTQALHKTAISLDVAEEDAPGEDESPSTSTTPSLNESSKKLRRKKKNAKKKERALDALEAGPEQVLTDAPATTALAYPARNITEDPSEKTASVQQSYLSFVDKGITYLLPFPSERAQRKTDQKSLTNLVGKENFRQKFVPLFFSLNAPLLGHMSGETLCEAFLTYIDTYYSGAKEGAVTSIKGSAGGNKVLRLCNNAIKEALSNQAIILKKSHELKISTSGSSGSPTVGPSGLDSSVGESNSKDEDALSGSNLDPFASHHSPPLIVSASEAMLIKKYFPGIPGDSFSTRCLVCAEAGHLTAACPALICGICQAHGDHFTSSCPQAQLCAKCRQPGHQKSACPEKLSATKGEGAVCAYCGSARHTEQACHYIWRSFKPDAKSIKRTNGMLMYCYSCGSEQHFGPECGLYTAPSLSGNITWSVSNMMQYVTDSNALLRASGTSQNSQPAQTAKRDFTIKGRARTDPISLDSEDDTPFIRPKVEAPPPRGSIRVNDYRPPDDRSERYAPRPPARSDKNSHRPNDDSARYRRERTLSPPPRFPQDNYPRGAPQGDRYPLRDREPGHKANEPHPPYRGNRNGGFTPSNGGAVQRGGHRPNRGGRRGRK
jgi:hypothetical protein